MRWYNYNKLEHFAYNYCKRKKEENVQVAKVEEKL